MEEQDTEVGNVGADAEWLYLEVESCAGLAKAGEFSTAQDRCCQGLVVCACAHCRL